MTMQKRTSRWTLIAAMAAPLWLGSLGLIQAAPANAPTGNGYLARLDRAVGLKPEQRDALRGLLAQQREKTQAIRADTDAKFRAMLTPDQQKRFDAFQAEAKAARKPAR